MVTTTFIVLQVQEQLLYRRIMAHFAKVDENNLVTEVIVIDNSIVDPENSGTDNESLGQTYIADVLGFEGNWQQCSYNANIRGNYASIGYTWDAENDEFIPPQPFASWTYNFSTHQWEAPVAHPWADITEDTVEQPAELAAKPDNEVWTYVWNEDTQAWDFTLIWASEHNSPGVDLSE